MKKVSLITIAVILVVSIFGSFSAFARTEVKPSAQANIPHEPHDFQRFSDGYLLSTPSGSGGNGFRNHWTPKMDDPNASMVVDDGDGELSLMLDSRTGVFNDHRYTKGYEFFVDIMGGGEYGKNFSGVLLDWGEENNKTDTGLITNNGVKAEGEGAMIGYSGCGFTLVDEDAKTLRFFVYTMDKELGMISTDIKTRSDFKDSFVSMEIVDTGKEIVFFADEDWICTIEYADPSLLPDGAEYDKYNEMYYRTAKIMDTDGTVLASTDKALISATGSIAFAAYNAPAYYDNIELIAVDEEFELPTAKPKATATPEVTEAPATEVPAATDAPATEATKAPADETPKADDEAKKGCGGTVTAGAFAVAAIAALVLRKKEN